MLISVGIARDPSSMRIKRSTDMTRLVPIATIPSQAPFIGSHRPKKKIMTAANRGSKGIRYACSTMENIHVFSIDALDIAKNSQDQRQPDHRFRRGQRNDKKNKALSPDIAGVHIMVEGDQIDIGGVKHEFDRHEDSQNIATRQHAVNND